jgi:hypothetical protein
MPARRSAGARTPAPVFSRAWTSRRLRAAAGAHAEGRRLAERPVVPARRALLPDAGRFAAGLPPAARFAALGRPPTTRGCIPDRCSRSFRCCPSTRTSRLPGADSPAGPQDTGIGFGERARLQRKAMRRPPAKPRPTGSGQVESAAGSPAPRCAPSRATASVHLHAAAAHAEDYLELVAAVEATAEDLRLPVVARRLRAAARPAPATLRITPDPGVIEVNIHPATAGTSWSSTTFLYEAAHESRLGTEKFMLDGRHTGTGGGNHFVLGGATPEPIRRSCAGPTCCAAWSLLAQPPVAVLPVLRPVHRPDQPGAAHRRGAQRLGVRDRDRLRANSRRRAGHGRRRRPG